MGPGPAASVIRWAFSRNANSWTPPLTYSQEMSLDGPGPRLHKPSRRLWCTPKFEDTWFIPINWWNSSLNPVLTPRPEKGKQKFNHILGEKKPPRVWFLSCCPLSSKRAPGRNAGSCTGEGWTHIPRGPATACGEGGSGKGSKGKCTWSRRVCAGSTQLRTRCTRVRGQLGTLTSRRHTTEDWECRGTFQSRAHLSG